MCLFCDDGDYDNVSSIQCPNAPNLWPDDFVPYPFALIDLTDMEVGEEEVLSLKTNSPPTAIPTSPPAPASSPSPPASQIGDASKVRELNPSLLPIQFCRYVGDFSRPSVPTLMVRPLIREADSTEDASNESSDEEIEFDDNSDPPSDSDESVELMDNEDASDIPDEEDIPVVEGVTDLEYCGVSQFNTLHEQFGDVDLRLFYSLEHRLFVFKIID